MLLFTGGPTNYFESSDTVMQLCFECFQKSMECWLNVLVEMFNITSSVIPVFNKQISTFILYLAKYTICYHWVIFYMPLRAAVKTTREAVET